MSWLCPPPQTIPEVIRQNLCLGCGACLSAWRPDQARMRRTEAGVVPELLDPGLNWTHLAWQDCPGKGLDLGDLYLRHYGHLPQDWRLGVIDRMWVGHATDADSRRQGASGGLTTAVLAHLLTSGRVDAVVGARQGKPSPESADWDIITDAPRVGELAGSVYLPVPMLAALPHLDPKKRYAMTCLPEQAAALRTLQLRGDARARAVTHLLGPYTGTALLPAAIRALLRSSGAAAGDAITSLRWRAGEWPGYLEIRLASGRTVRSPKVYYNFLIPFYIWPPSLRGLDFANEFTDLSVGDAWSPRWERLGQGFSVVLSRQPAMTALLEEMRAAGKIHLEPIDPSEAANMHGHMIDFKKRGGFLRNELSRRLGRPAPDWGLAPHPVGLSRFLIELVVTALFFLGSTSLARWGMEQIPQGLLGPLFNRLRLAWKALSKPTKRRGLRHLTMTPYRPRWKHSATA